MRTITLQFVFLAVALLALAQQPTAVEPNVSAVLDRMKSAMWTERSNAFGEATDLMESGKASAGDVDRLRLGIMELLAHENNGGLKEADNVTSENYGEGYGEGKSGYYAGLIAFVAGLNDERAIPALLGAAGSGGMATRAVAQFGKKALDATLAEVKSQDAHQASCALFVIREMLRMHTLKDQDSHIRIKTSLRSALVSPDYRVRRNAMWPIEYLDDREEFVPILQDIAAHDPYKSPHSIASQEEVNQYVVRRSAELLLRKIANHEAPVIDREVSQ